MSSHLQPGRRRPAFVSLALALATSAAAGIGCGRIADPADAPGRIRIGVVFDVGGRDDQSFNASAWRGLRCAETGTWPDGTPCGKPSLGIVFRDVEPGTPSNVEPAIRAFAERHYDLIIGVGSSETPMMNAVAKDYPDTHFAIVDGDSDLPNVASLVFRDHEGSYLVGILAAKATRSRVIGFLGGMDISLIHRFLKGYEEGAKSVDPGIRVVPNYVGVTEAAWNNPGKGKELALAQIDKGADVIFAAAGSSGLGAFDAVEAQGTDAAGRATHFVIGVDSNQNMVKPGFVLTSMLKRVDNAVYQIVQDVVAHRFRAGVHVFGLDTDGVGYAVDEHNRHLLSPDAIQAAERARARIVAGEIKVTDAMVQ